MWPKLEQIWARTHRGHRWAFGVYDPLKSLVMGPSVQFTGQLISRKQVSQINQADPPPLNTTHFDLRGGGVDASLAPVGGWGPRPPQKCCYGS